jgi:hypothetical protein
MHAAIWTRSAPVLAVTMVAACLPALMAGALSGPALATPQEDHGAQVTRSDGKVVGVEVPADRHAGERVGGNPRTETGKASVVRTTDVAGSVMITFGIVDPIRMVYDAGLRHLDLSGLSQLSWSEGYTGYVSVREDDSTLADEAIEGDTMTLYPPPGYVAFPAAPTVLTLTIYATSRFKTIMYRSWPFELQQL